METIIAALSGISFGQLIDVFKGLTAQPSFLESFTQTMNEISAAIPQIVDTISGFFAGIANLF